MVGWFVHLQVPRGNSRSNNNDGSAAPGGTHHEQPAAAAASIFGGSILTGCRDPANNHQDCAFPSSQILPALPPPPPPPASWAPKLEAEVAADTLAQVVSKYVNESKPLPNSHQHQPHIPARAAAVEQHLRVDEPKECLLSTQVPYSDDTSTISSASPNSADTASSSSPEELDDTTAAAAAADSPGLFSLSSEVEASEVGPQRRSVNLSNNSSSNPNLFTPSRNPDNLESILRPNNSELLRPRAAADQPWAWDLLPEFPTPPAPAPESVMYHHVKGGGDLVAQTWTNLCELPDEFPSDASVNAMNLMVSNDMIKSGLQVSSTNRCNNSVVANLWHYNLYPECFPISDWESLSKCQESASLCSALSESNGIGESTAGSLQFLPGDDSDLYMNDQSMQDVSGIIHPMYDDGCLFPHLMEESRIQSRGISS
jgi:hypothetical protein